MVARRILPACVLLVSVAAAQEMMRSRPLVPLPIKSVHIDDKFWAPRIEVNRNHTLATVYRKLIETGAIDNLDIAAGKKNGKFRGPFWSDSDVYKWIEGASWSLAQRPDPQLEARVDDVIAKIAAAQMKDGYIDTYFQLVYPEGRWKFLAFGHEMFCAGHLYEAAVAHYEATGKRTFLNVAIKNADHIDSVFGPAKRDGQPGHEEIELALVKLYRATGEKRYLKLAQYFIDHRGRRPSFFQVEYDRLDPNFRTDFLGRTIGLRTLYDEFFRKDPERFDTQYSQDHEPVRRQDKVVGHAVRAMYLYSGMADVAAETQDTGLFAALQRLYTDLTTKRIYVTGGIGPSAENEGFTRDYDLPNATAYQETCASIGVAMWGERMLGLTGDSRYADTMERALYNGFLAGVSLDGNTFFYDNPLYSPGNVTRKEWFTVPCCPTNVARIMPSIGKFIYSESPDGLWVNLYVQSRVTAAPGVPMGLTQQTNAPWDGAVKLTISKAPAGEYGLHLRVPAWSGEPEFNLNGKPLQPAVDKGYAIIRRQWAAGDVIDAVFPMRAHLLEANPNVLEDRGRVALSRGPFIYCLEQADNDVDLDRLMVPRTIQLEARYDPSKLGGVSVLTAQALVSGAPDWKGELYRPAQPAKPRGATRIEAVPYCVWNNRGRGKMAVWVEGAH
jgi:DUF1680 family protein